MKTIFNIDSLKRGRLVSLFLACSAGSVALFACGDDVTTGEAAAGTAGAPAGAGGAGTAGAPAGAGGAGAAGAPGGAGGAGGGAPAVPEVLALSATGHSRLLGVTFGPDGSAYAVGTLQDTTDATADVATIVVKFGPNSQLDPSFGTAGVARHNLVVGTNGESARGIAVLADGKIVVMATVDHTGGDPKDRDVAVARLLPTGALDPSFGDGGVKVHDLSAGVALPDGGFTADMARGGTATPDGKILIAAAKKRDGATDRDHTMVRLTADGALDASFGTGGLVSFDIAGQGADPRGLLLLADGSVLGAGYTKAAAGVVTPVLYKVTPSGALDPSFGTGGVFNQLVLPLVTEAYGMGLQGDKLVTNGYGKAADSETLDWISLRVDKDGKLDPTYGNNGHILVDAAGFNDNGRAVLALPDGRVLLAGAGRTDANSSDAMLALLSKDGAPDASFGPKGIKLYDLGGTSDVFWSAALSPDQKRVAIVGLTGGTGTHDDAAILFLATP